MSTLKDLIKSNTKSNTLRKYSSVKLYPSILSEKRQFSEEEKKHLTRKGFRWYVYYDFLNPATGSLTRQPPVYFEINRIRSFNDRFKEILIIKESIEELLKEGWSPYDEKTENKYTAKSCLEFALDLKKGSVGSRTFETYQNHHDSFLQYLIKKGLANQSISEVKKLTVTNFLNQVLKNTSARNRNNYRSSLSAIFSILEDNELIDRNFIKSIPVLSTKPKRNNPYNESVSDRIFEHLQTHDWYLLLFIKLVSYNLLRPVEVARLKCGDIDLKNKLLRIESKTKDNKLKVIPDVLIDDLAKLDLSNPDYFVFTPNDRPGPIETSDRDKRGYWGKRFNKVKSRFNLGAEYSIYSFRHTYIMKLYRWLRSQYHISETLDRLQLITGHDSIQGLKNYLRKIDAELPNDWSEGLK